MMSSLINSQGVALATAVAVSGSLIILSIFRNHQDSSRLRPCISSSSSEQKGRERRKGRRRKFDLQLWRVSRKLVLDKNGIMMPLPPNRMALSRSVISSFLDPNVAAFRISPSLDSSSICLYGSSGCLGCASKHELISSVNLKEQNHQERKVRKRNSISSDYFWTPSSTRGIEHCAVPSHGSISPLALSNHSEFVNHGLLLWNQTRQQWIGNNRSTNHTDEICEPRLSWNATCESVLGSNKRYAKPVSLPEMVDFLMDIWIGEGKECTTK